MEGSLFDLNITRAKFDNMKLDLVTKVLGSANDVILAGDSTLMPSVQAVQTFFYHSAVQEPIDDDQSNSYAYCEGMSVASLRVIEMSSPGVPVVGCELDGGVITNQCLETTGLLWTPTTSVDATLHDMAQGGVSHEFVACVQDVGSGPVGPFGWGEPAAGRVSATIPFIRAFIRAVIRTNSCSARAFAMNVTGTFRLCRLNLEEETAVVVGYGGEEVRFGRNV